MGWRSVRQRAAEQQGEARRNSHATSAATGQQPLHLGRLGKLARFLTTMGSGADTMSQKNVAVLLYPGCTYAEIRNGRRDAVNSTAKCFTLRPTGRI